MKNEIWRVYTASLPSTAPSDRTHDLILVGFNPSTKKKLHEYGPFETDAEVVAFCREHSIPPPAGYRFK